MNAILTILAVAGIAAAAWHVLRAAVRFLSREAAGLWSDELARTRARRGDVTGLQDARREKSGLARLRRRALGEALGWTALLLAPAVTPWARTIYATYVVLWLVPFLGRRGGGGGGAS